MRPPDYILSLMFGLTSSERGNRWLMAIQVFMDDSGSASHEPYFVLGGFASTDKLWAKFSNEWKAELDKKPSIKYFKMREAFHKKNQFENWKEEDIEKKKNALFSIIKKYAKARISISLKRSEYEQYVKGKIPKEIDDPYFLCFHAIVYAVCLHAYQHHWDAPIDFIFDDQGALGNYTLAWSDFVRDKALPEVLPYIGGLPIFRDDVKFLPLQAADIYAWSVRRYKFENKYIHMPHRDELKVLFAIEENITHAVNCRNLPLCMPLDGGHILKR